MSQKLVSVDSIVETLMKEGYETLDSDLDLLDLSRGYFNSAFFIAEKFGVLCSTINNVFLKYLARRKKIHRWVHSVTLPQEILMLKFARLGADKKILESFALELARCGGGVNFKTAVSLLGRGPTKEEVELILKSYLEGAIESENQEKELIELASGISSDLGSIVSKKIKARKRLLELYCD